MSVKTTASRPPAASAVGPEPDGPSTGIVTLLYALLAFVYFLPAFMPGRHIFGTDYLAGTYFFWEVISEQLARGEVPRWLPYLYGGLPLFANPGSTFYPFWTALALALPLPRVMPALLVIQFTLAGVGMFLLARALGARRWVAMVAGLAFQFTGILMSAVYAGHDGRIIVATLAPLLFFFLHRAVRTGAVWAFSGVAATVGFALLSFQIQSSYYLLLAGLGWAVFLLVHSGVHRRRGDLAVRVGLGLAGVAFGFALAAVNFLPFLDYVPESPRGGAEGRGYEYSTSWSMPPAELSALAVPEIHGASVQAPDGRAALGEYRGENPFKLHTEYVGALVLVLLILGVRYARDDRRWWFFLGLAVVFLTIAFGGHTPVYRLYYEILPGTKRFRAPSISFFVVAMSLVAMAAITLERLARERVSARAARTARLGGQAGAPEVPGLPGLTGTLAVIGGLAVLGLLIGAGAGGATAVGFLRLALFALATCTVLWLWLSARLRTAVAMTLLAAVAVLDLWSVGRPFFTTVPPPEYSFAADDVADFLLRQPGRDRVWVLPFPTAYRGHGDYLMRFGIDQAGGEHSNPLQRFYEYVGEGEASYVDWRNFIEAPQFIDAANIRYIISMVELESPVLREVHRGSALIYENPGALPRAYLTGSAITAPEPGGALEMMRDPDFDPAQTTVVYAERAISLPDGPLEGEAQILDYTQDRVVVRTRASREALLVLADNDYEGWRATVGGRDAPILRANHTFRAVRVPAGEHQVVFEFAPADLKAGLWLTVLGLVVLALHGGFVLVRHLRGRRAADAG